MHTVAFLASAKDEGISTEERADIVSIIGGNPEAGEIIVGAGGARKVRVAGRGKGKSGGYRVITFYADQDIPVFLLDIYSKDSQSNLTMAERNALRSILTDLPRVWREGVKIKVRKLRRSK